MIDVSWLVAGGFVLSTGWQFLEARRKSQRADYWKSRAECLTTSNGILWAKVEEFEAEKRARNAHLKRIASDGARASNAKRKGVRKAAVAKTIADLGCLTKTRAQVVAPVKAKRTKARNQAEGVAQKQG